MEKSHKIMIVDDDKLNLKFLSVLLEEYYDIDPFLSGEEALASISQTKPDIVLLDVMMPGLNGYEVCRKIRADKNLSTTKIILLTAKSQLNDRLEGYKAGADDYIVKPYNQEELLAKIKIFLRLKYTEEINEFKDNLLILQSHETNTPLSKILGLASLLKENSKLSEEEQHYLDIIIESGNRLLTNSDKILLLCQLKNEMEISKRKISIELLVQHLFDNFLELSSIKDVILIHKNEHSKELDIDSELVESALSHIIENAINASPKGGEVIVESKSTHSEYIIRITDQGAGIKKTPIESVFYEFAEDDFLHHSTGLGISLAIAKNIIHLHSGKLLVENNENGGASFSVHLPL